MTYFRISVASVLVTLAACSPPVTVKQVQPELARIGNPETILVSFNTIPEGTRFDIVPGGIVTLDRVGVPAPVSRILIDANRIISQTGDRQIAFWTIDQNHLIRDVDYQSENSINNIFAHKDSWWIWSQSTLVKFEKHSPSSPTGTITLGRQPTLLSMNDDLLCIFDDQSGLSAGKMQGDSVQFGNPVSLKQKPKFVTSVSTGCVVAMENGILRSYRFDNHQVMFAGSYTLQASVDEIVYRDGYLHIANSATGYTVLEVSDDHTLKWISSFHKGGSITTVSPDQEKSLIASSDRVLSLISTRQIDTLNLLGDLRLDTPLSAIAFHQGRGVVATANELRLLDFSKQTAPIVSSFGSSWGGSRRSAISGDTLYVADWFSGFHVYDIRNRQAIHHLATVHTTGSAKGVLIDDDIAYVGDDDQGLQVVDVRDPSRPKILSQLPLPGLAYTMAKLGSRLFLAGHHGGLHIIDIANPRTPKRLGGYDTPGKSWAVQAHGNYAYVADDKSGMLVFNVAEPDNVQLVSQFNPGGQAEEIVLDYPYAYLAFFDLGFFILDVSNPEKPNVLSQISLPGNARGIALSNKLAYVTGWQAGLHALDISNRRDPKLIGTYDTSGYAWGVSVRDTQAYVMDWWGGVSALDITNPTNMRLIQTYHGAEIIRDIALSDHFIFAASGSLGLQVFDGRNALNPIWATTREISGSANAIHIDDDYAYLGTDKGVSIFNVSDPYNPVLLNEISTRSVDSIVGNDHLLCVTTRDTRSEFYSVENKERPEKIATNIQTVYSMDADEQACYVAQKEKITRHQIQNKKLIETTVSTIAAEKIALSDHLLFAKIRGANEIKVIQRRDFNTVTTIRTEENIDDIFADTENLVVNSKGKQIHRFRFRSNEIVSSEIYSTRHNTTNGILRNGRLYFAGEAALVTAELLPEYEATANNNSLQLKIPASMPLGSYHIKMSSSQNQPVIFANLFHVGIPQPKKQRFTVEDLKKKMQQKDFDGRAPSAK